MQRLTKSKRDVPGAKLDIIQRSDLADLAAVREYSTVSGALIS